MDDPDAALRQDHAPKRAGRQRLPARRLTVATAAPRRRAIVAATAFTGPAPMLDPTIPIILAGIVLAFALTMRLSRPYAQTPPGGEAPYVAKLVLNEAERRLHPMIERLLPPGHRLFLSGLLW